MAGGTSAIHTKIAVHHRGRAGPAVGIAPVRASGVSGRACPIVSGTACCRCACRSLLSSHRMRSWGEANVISTTTWRRCRSETRTFDSR